LSLRAEKIETAGGVQMPVHGHWAMWLCSKEAVKARTEGLAAPVPV